MKRIRLETGDVTTGMRAHFTFNAMRESSMDGVQVNFEDYPGKEEIMRAFNVNSTARFQLAMAGFEIAKSIDLTRMDDPQEIIIGRCQVLLNKKYWCMPKGFATGENLYFVPPEVFGLRAQPAAEELVDENRLAKFQLATTGGKLFSRFYIPFNTPIKYSKEVMQETKELWEAIRDSKSA